MTLAVLTFSEWRWLWPAAVFLGLALLALIWSYQRFPAHPLRWVCLGLKAVALAALALCLLEPLWTGQRARPGANLFAVVADNSQGLQIKDRGAARSRGDDLRALLADGAWQQALADTFDVRRYLFDTRLQPSNGFGELTFDGRSSALGSSLRTLGERFRGRPLAGVVLFTDGNATDLAGGLPDLAGLPPIYPVVMGGGVSPRDLSLQQVSVNQTVFEDAPVSIQAEVATPGFGGSPVVARLVDATGRIVQEQTQEARGDRDTLAFRFQVKPEKPGLSFYQVRVSPRDAASTASPAAGGESAEATLANNTRVLAIDRGRGPYRILYVAGRPNWEYKFLNRAAAEDKEVELVGLIRVAKREPKFDFRGRAGESSNPLFRGFGNQAPEEVERYDQPVMVRLNTRDEVELRSGFPLTPEELYGYHAIVVDDLEAEFFKPEQAALVEKFVAERGGGFMMLGGMESFQEGKYQRTPIGDVLPVYLEPPDETTVPTPDETVRMNLAREGWLQPWARLRDNEADERARLEAMPSFQVLNRARALKPGASVIATARDENGAESPALAVQRFGRGRSAALLVGDVWRWGMRDPEARADMEKAWRQWLRWLVADVPRRVELSIEPPAAELGGAVALQVRVRDAKFQAVDDASVTVTIEPVMTDPTEAGAASAGPVRLQAEPSLKEAGLYETSYVPRLTAGYRATAVVTNNAGAELGRAEAGWSTDLAAEEFRSLTPNVALLEEIGRKTGGRVVAASELATFARGLPDERAPVMEAWSQPVWHTPALFAFALACLIAEWGLRRGKGMP